MKSAKYFLSKLPKSLSLEIEEQIQAHKRTKPYDFNSEDHYDFSDFLMGAFRWDQTGKGHAFWKNIMNKYKYKFI
jgi:hypothetical protein